MYKVTITETVEDLDGVLDMICGARTTCEGCPFQRENYIFKCWKDSYRWDGITKDDILNMLISNSDSITVEEVKSNA